MPEYKGTAFKLRDRCGNVQADFSFNGQRHRKNWPTAGEAETWVKEAIDRLLDGATADRPSAKAFATPTIQHVFDVLYAEEWKGTRGGITSKKNAEDCIAFIGGETAIDEVTTATIDAMIADFKDKELEPGTIRRKLSALSRILHLAAEKGWLAAIPVIRRKAAGKERSRNRYIKADEEPVLLDYLKFIGKNADFFAFMIDTGLRLSESVNLEWSEIDYSKDGTVPEWVRVPENKADYPRSVPCTMRVAEMLSRRRAERPIKERRVWWDVTVNRAQYEWDLVRTHMGLEEDEDFVLHVCRHTFASRLVQAGIDLGTVKELGGWKTLAMVMRYAHLSPDAKRSAVQKMEGTHQTKSVTGAAV